MTAVIHFYDKDCHSQMLVKILKMMMIMTIDSSLNGKCSCYTVILILVMAVTDDSENTFDIPNLLWLKT